MFTENDPVELALVRGRNAAAAGQAEQASAAYQEALDGDERNLEALNFLAIQAMRTGRHAQGLDLLRRATAAAPESAPTWMNFGLACYESDALEEAQQAFARAAELAPELHAARLMTGAVHERRGERFAALGAYFRAIASAQKRGLWQDEPSTPVGLRPQLRHAMNFLRQFRGRVLGEVLAPLRVRYGHDDLRRLEAFVKAAVEDVLIQPEDARQKPQKFCFPGLPAQPYFDLDLFPWMQQLESETDAMREEAEDILGGAVLQPFLQLSAQADRSRYLEGANAAWDGFFFYRHGRHFADNALRCPRTAQAIEALPLVRVRGNAPEVLFSVLAPGTRIMPHYGVTNTRVVLHLPLIVPPACALRVADEEHAWQEGRGVVFDDTYLHEAWNNSAQSRVVLIADMWNPHLSEVERAALAELVPLIEETEATLRGG